MSRVGDAAAAQCDPRRGTSACLSASSGCCGSAAERLPRPVRYGAGGCDAVPSAGPASGCRDAGLCAGSRSQRRAHEAQAEALAPSLAHLVPLPLQWLQMYQWQSIRDSRGRHPKKHSQGHGARAALASCKQPPHSPLDSHHALLDCPHRWHPGQPAVNEEPQVFDPVAPRIII